MVDGQISLKDLEEVLDIKFEEGLPYDTLAGLILQKLGQFPVSDEKIIWNEFVLSCEKVTPTSIVTVKIIKSKSKE